MGHGLRPAAFAQCRVSGSHHGTAGAVLALLSLLVALHGIDVPDLHLWLTFDCFLETLLTHCRGRSDVSSWSPGAPAVPLRQEGRGCWAWLCTPPPLTQTHSVPIACTL